jgi:ribokinase/sulfofructose kinase
VLVDHIGVAGMARAARVARAAGIAVVADFERDPGPGFPALLAPADHLVVGRDFAARLTGEADPAAAARALWRVDRAAAVVTCGASGCWAAEGPGPGAPRHRPAFAVATVDTTGCGDVFHGAYAAAPERGAGVRWTAPPGLRGGRAEGVAAVGPGRHPLSRRGPGAAGRPGRGAVNSPTGLVLDAG